MSDQMNLFEEQETGGGAPLASRLRPETLDEYVGQKHLVGPGKKDDTGSDHRTPDESAIYRIQCGKQQYQRD